MSAHCMYSGAEDCPECEAPRKRIAELEAENARLKLAPFPWETLKRDYEQVKRERDEARAACAAKNEALRLQDPRNSTERYERIADAFYDKHHRMAPGQSRPMEMGSDPDPDETQRLWRAFCNEWHEAFFDAALSPTAGSEHWASSAKLLESRGVNVPEALEKAAENMPPQLPYAVLLARLEKAEAEVETTKTCLLQMQNANIDLMAQLQALQDAADNHECVEPGLRAQLESMRAALGTLIGHVEIAAVMPEATGKTLVYALKGPELSAARAALLPSAPRLSIFEAARQMPSSVLVSPTPVGPTDTEDGTRCFEARIRADEREQAAQCCDRLAEMMESGAGELGPGWRLRQAAENIRARGGGK